MTPKQHQLHQKINWLRCERRSKHANLNNRILCDKIDSRFHFLGLLERSNELSWVARCTLVFRTTGTAR